MREFSVFASALRALLDVKRGLTRAQWAEVLDVSESTIAQWTADKTIPSAEALRMILRTFCELDDVPQRPLKRFEALCRRPANAVSPHSDRIGKTVEHYLATPLLEAFLSNLRTLSGVEQEQVLLLASAICREIRGVRRR